VINHTAAARAHFLDIDQMNHNRNGFGIHDPYRLTAMQAKRFIDSKFYMHGISTVCLNLASILPSIDTSVGETV
jgi:hypothetical protein